MDVDEKECISILRSCLLSTANVITANRLFSEYQELEGKPFPYKKLGFSSFVDYLKSIPTEVKVSGGHNPDVLPVRSEASKHIEQLVLKQRTSTPRRRGTGRRRGGGAGGFGYRGPAPGPRRRPPSIVPVSYNQAPLKVQPTDYDSEFMKDLLWDLVKRVAGSRTGVFVRDIERELLDKYGKVNLNRNGIHSMDDVRRQSGDMLQWTNDKVYPNMSATPDYTDEPSLSIGRPPLSDDEDYYDDDDDYDDSYPQQTEEQEATPDNVDAAIIENMDEEQLSNYTIAKLSKLSVGKNIDTYREEETNEYLNGGSQDHEDSFSSQMIKNFRAILTKHPDGIWSRDLPHKYFEETGCSLDIQLLGYDSAMKLASCLPSVFYHERCGMSDFRLFDARTARHKNNSNSNSEDNKSREMAYIPESVKQNIQELLNYYSNGVRSMELRSLYEDHFKKRLDVEKLGFNRIEDFLENIKDVVTVTRANNYYLLLPKFKVIPFEVDKPADDSALPEPRDFIGPEDVMLSGDIIVDQELPPIALQTKPEDYLMEMEVRVGDVVTPHMFYIMLDSRFVELENMMDDLHKFYEREEHHYKIVPTYLKENLYCACLYREFWHRVKILKLNRNTAKILYIDYGTPDTVKYTDLRYLHVDFAKLPIQAIYAKLMGIQPCNKSNKWPQESKEMFLKMVADKRLLARVYAFLRSENSKVLQLSMILYDMLSSEEIIINEYLVENGYADYVIKVENKPEDKPHQDSFKPTPISMNTTMPSSVQQDQLFSEEEKLKDKTGLPTFKANSNIKPPTSQPMAKGTAGYKGEDLAQNQHHNVGRNSPFKPSMSGATAMETANNRVDDFSQNRHHNVLGNSHITPQISRAMATSSNRAEDLPQYRQPNVQGNSQHMSSSSGMMTSAMGTGSNRVDNFVQKSHPHVQANSQFMPSSMSGGMAMGTAGSRVDYFPQNRQRNVQNPIRPPPGFEMTIPNTAPMHPISNPALFPQFHSSNAMPLQNNQFFYGISPNDVSLPPNLQYSLSNLQFTNPLQGFYSSSHQIPQQRYLPNNQFYGNSPNIQVNCMINNSIPSNNLNYNMSLNNQRIANSYVMVDNQLKPINFSSTPANVTYQGMTTCASIPSQTISTDKPAAQVMPLKAVESLPSAVLPSNSGNSQNELEREGSTLISKSSTVIDASNSHMNIESSSSLFDSHELFSSDEEIHHVEEDTGDNLIEPTLSSGSKERTMSSTSDEYVSAGDVSDDNFLSEAKITSENQFLDGQRSIEKIPESWEDIDVDDTPAKADNYHADIDLNKSLDYLKGDKYNSYIDFSENTFTNAIKNIKIKDHNSNSFNTNKDLSANWKEYFNPDVKLSPKGIEKEENQQSNKMSINVKSTLIQKIDHENKLFTVILVNNNIAVIAQEFYPLFTDMKWTSLNRIVEVADKPFPSVSRDKEPELFKKLDDAEFNIDSTSKKIKFRKSAVISYISDIPKVLSFLNIENTTLFKKLKMVEESFKSSS